MPPHLANDIAFLKGQIYMVNGRFAEAEKIFHSLQNTEGLEGFAIYNLGVSLLAQEKQKEGILSLAKAGQLSSSDRAELAIKDKANLTLGSRLLESGDLQAAKQYLERVRLDGPFSNRALLGLGWADVKTENYERALVPWTVLAKRNVTDASVQEAMVGVPYSYGKLGLYGKSALMYGRALDAIGTEIDKLDASIKSIKEGKFLKALVREEIKQDRNWVIRLRELEDMPETYYLMSLMASHDFQSSLQNYLDLEQLRKRLESWEEYYTAYEDIIAHRRQYYEPLLPGIDEKFRKLDSVIRLRLEQREKLDTRLQSMLVAPRPDFLATADERLAREAITRLEKRIGKKRLLANPVVAHRIDRIKGYLHWNIHTEYDERLTQAFQNLYALDKDIARLKEIYGSFVRTRQAATQSYQGYDEQIRRLRIKTRNALTKVDTLMARQGHMLEVMAVNQLVQRRQKLEESQVKARFAMAESYDRATQSQAPAGEAQGEGEAEKAEAPDAESPSGTQEQSENAAAAGTAAQAQDASQSDSGAKASEATVATPTDARENAQREGQDEQ